MRKGISSPYILLAVCLFLWLSLPRNVSDEMRKCSVASLSPVWGWTKDFKRYLSDRPYNLWSVKKGGDQELIARLELENGLLRNQMGKMSQWLLEEERLSKQLEIIKIVDQQKAQTKDPIHSLFFERRRDHLLSLVRSELMAMPSQVIYRDPSLWSSSLWINVGDDDNRVLGSLVIAKNSPVVLGLALVGVIDYVGKKQSRVRLITDSALSPAVRAVRGFSQDFGVQMMVDSLVKRLSGLDGKEKFIESLQLFKETLPVQGKDMYLAKGELHGSGFSLWRARGSLLKGVGFNFDYPDQEGCLQKGVPLLQKGDLLVTTGFDGVFPPDLEVGVVVDVTIPSPGGYAYEIDVLPIVDDMNDLSTLFVLPPRSD
jgi:rod shape-determining protein MreC